MRQIVITQTGTGSSDLVTLDTYQAPFQVSVGVAISDSADTIIQHTFSNVFDSSVTPVWYDTTAAVESSDFLLAENGDFLIQEDDSYILTGNENFDHYIDFPVSAIRLNTVSNSGTITMTVLQAGMPGR